MRPKERLLRRGTKNASEAIRNALEDWSDRLSGWENFFTALVVGGLVIEYFPEVARFMPTPAFIAIQPHLETLREAGGFLVIVGVAGELAVSIRASRVETDLRDESKKSISEASERAARAEQAAAEANERAENANLERAKLESRFKRRTLSRDLTPDEKAALAEAMAKYKGQKFILQRRMPLIDGAPPPSDKTSEQISFEIQLREILSSAGWEHTDDSLPDLGVKYGVTVFTPAPWGENMQASALVAGSDLYFALRKLDLSCDISQVPDSGAVIIAIGLL